MRWNADNTGCKKGDAIGQNVAVGERGGLFMQIKKRDGIRFVSLIKDYDDIVRRLSA